MKNQKDSRGSSPIGSILLFRLQNLSLYEGVFITSVTTTGIFCRPSCRAKKPKAENVIFYDTPKQAIQNGFRPYKICKPMDLKGEEGEEPDYIQNIFGEPSKNINEKNVINIIRFTTKLGAMFACATDRGLCLLEFTDRRMLETEFQDLCKRLNAVILPGKNRYLDLVQIQVLEYFEGKRKDFTIPLLTPGTEFQQSVWKVLHQIPYGETWSYKEQAVELNKPKAVRAVATANGYNRIAFIIPCHRVIGSNGDLTGYGGGLGRKKWLLQLERRNSGKVIQEEIAFE